MYLFSFYSNPLIIFIYQRKKNAYLRCGSGTRSRGGLKVENLALMGNQPSFTQKLPFFVCKINFLDLNIGRLVPLGPSPSLVSASVPTESLF